MSVLNCCFGDVTENFDKKRIPLSGSQRDARKGQYRYYGAQGVIDYIDDFIFDGTYLLIAEDGENLKSQKQNIAQIVEGKFWANNHAHIVKSNGLCDLRYLCYCINTMDVSGYITGSAQPKLSQANLNAIPLQLPEINVQHKIADFLQMLDQKILINEKINDNLELQAQLIYSERFEGVKSNDLPSGWRVVPLGEIAMISNKNFNPLKESERILEHYSIPAFDETKFPIFEPSTSIKSNKFVVDSSCFLISKLNPTVKRVWKPYCLTGSAVCSTEFIVYKSKNSYITDFLYSVIDSNSFSDFMCSHVTGSTGSRQRTIPSDTLSYKVILPSEDELIRFQSLVSPIYSRIRNNAIENDRLKQLRNSLLPKLMSGEIDVSSIKI